MAEQIADLMEGIYPASSDASVLASAAAEQVAARKVDKNGTGQILMANLSEGVKKAMTGGSVPVVGDASVYSGAIQMGAVTDDKVPERELTGARINDFAGIGMRLIARSDTILDVRGTTWFRSAGLSEHNVVDVRSSDIVAVTPGEGDTAMIVQIPILRSPDLVNIHLQIAPKPKLLLASNTTLDSQVQIRSWNAASGSGVVDRILTKRSVTFSDDEAYIVCAGSNPKGNKYLVIQIPVDPSERGTRFLLKLAGTADRWLGRGVSHGIQMDMVKPVSMHFAVGLYGPIPTGRLTAIDGINASWKVADGKRNGVTTFDGISSMIGADMGQLWVYTECNQPIRINPVVRKTGGTLYELPMAISVPAGSNVTKLDLAEIDAHGDAPLDQIWFTSQADGDYTLKTNITIRDKYWDDGDLRGTLARIEALATKPIPEQTLASPDGNKWRIIVGNDGTLAAQSLSKRITRMHVIGNSLTYLGWTGWTCGMAASSPEKDWVWMLVQKLRTRNDAVVFHCWDDEDKTSDTVTRVNGYAFESSASAESIMHLVATVPADADLVILQLGDNVNTDARRMAFNQQVGALAQAIHAKASGAIIVFVSGWFDQPTLNSAIDDAMVRIGGWHLTIGDLNTRANRATLGQTVTYPDRTTHVIDSAGVAQHPGDLGMSAIADRIWQTLSPIVKGSNAMSMNSIGGGHSLTALKTAATRPADWTVAA